ncbi:MAG TPA: hypothetical protein VKL61_04300 [Candidatus Polarisedimenticolia bacterium]|nr:hypothetical protein [Candidatus Polarisedimenticolia bacterium]
MRQSFRCPALPSATRWTEGFPASFNERNIAPGRTQKTLSPLSKYRSSSAWVSSRGIFRFA